MFDIVQGAEEPTRKYVDRFLEASKNVKGYDDKLAILALRRGLQKGNLRFESHKHEFATLQEFVQFAGAYIRGEEDAASEEEVEVPKNQKGKYV